MVERISERSAGMVKVFAPAKINLFLAVMGKRDDGYHELCSVFGKTFHSRQLRNSEEERGEGYKDKMPGI